MSKNTQYVAAIDQGTTSTRCILFDHAGETVCSHQIEHQQIYPKPGWVEHDALEIWQRVQETIKAVLEKASCSSHQICSVGITNQRETVVAWDPETGIPYYNAIVWQDMRGSEYIDACIREGGIALLQEQTGVPLSPYFAGSKIKWLAEHVREIRRAMDRGRICFGTIDSWLIWNLTGGVDGGVFITDVTNASRYLMMDIRRLAWDQELTRRFQVQPEFLPEIRPSFGTCYGMTEKEGPFGGEVPLCGILGDQQAALFGQACFQVGQGKNTYGTGCFLLVNTGEEYSVSSNGLLTTLAYQQQGKPPVYALEGSIAVAGALIQWLRDNIGLVGSAPEINTLASSVLDNGGVYFVPAFSGLYAPYWDSSARGTIVGLTGYVKSGHLARAVLEATAYQTKDIVDAMEKDSSIPIQELRVDGGMSQSDILMQYQADILQVPVIKPRNQETTALGAAYAAGLSQGFWGTLDDVADHWKEGRRWETSMEPSERDRQVRKWHRAVDRAKQWETKQQE